MKLMRVTGLSHLSRIIAILRQLVVLTRAGIFDTQSYIEANPDLHRVRWPKLHFVQHGRHEERRFRTSPLRTWCLNALLAGQMSSAFAKELDDLEGVGMLPEALHRLERSGHDTDLIRFAIALEQGDEENLRLILCRLSDLSFFNGVFELSLHRMDSRFASQAFEWGLKQMRSKPELDLTFFSRLRSLGEILSFKPISSHEFHLEMLRAIKRCREFSADNPWPVLRALALPISKEDDDSFGLAVSRLQTALELDLATHSLENSGLNRKQSRLLNVATINALSEEKTAIDANRDWAMVSASGVSIVNLRLPVAHIWWKPARSAFHKSVIDATMTLVNQINTGKEKIYPTHAGRLHTLDLYSATDEPVVSYHSIGGSKGKFAHYKESALPGCFSLDCQGYSGWSSWSSRDYTNDGQSRIDLTSFRRQFRLNKASKYAQSTTKRTSPTGGVLFPLQIPNDTVMSLAYLSSQSVAQTLCQVTKENGLPLVIKAHPFDFSRATNDWLAQLRDRYPHLVVANAHIHDLINAADCVVVANSGVGLEALILETPVITFAPSEYAVATRIVRRLDELKSVVGEVVLGEVTDADRANRDEFLSSFLGSGLFRPGVRDSHVAAQLGKIIGDSADGRSANHD